MDKIELYKGTDKDNQICQIKTIETIVINSNGTHTIVH